VSWCTYPDPAADQVEGYRNSDSAHDLHLPSHLRCDSLSRGERWDPCPRGSGESGARGTLNVWVLELEDPFTKAKVPPAAERQANPGRRETACREPDPNK
jgi:hypothetical protein